MIRKINRENPRIAINVRPDPVGVVRLSVKRVGGVDSVLYNPLQNTAGQLTFQFDERLFKRKQGRYIGTLTVGGKTLGSVALQYTEPTGIVGVENV